MQAVRRRLNSLADYVQIHPRRSTPRSLGALFILKRRGRGKLFLLNAAGERRDEFAARRGLEAPFYDYMEREARAMCLLERACLRTSSVGTLPAIWQRAAVARHLPRAHTSPWYQRSTTKGGIHVGCKLVAQPAASLIRWRDKLATKICQPPRREQLVSSRAPRLLGHTRDIK